jgi:hypothetical protein
MPTACGDFQRAQPAFLLWRRKDGRESWRRQAVREIYRHPDADRISVAESTSYQLFARERLVTWLWSTRDDAVGGKPTVEDDAARRPPGGATYCYRFESGVLLSRVVGVNWAVVWR